MDPRVGYNQKRATVRKRIDEKFNLMYEDAYDMEEDDGVKALGG
jgi:hypothetical protein